MMTPLVEDITWQQAVARMPAWPMPEGPVLAVVPHPDDEVLGLGGLLWTLRASGREVRVVAVTDGEAAYPEWTPRQRAQLAESRRSEQMHALARLGVPPECVIRLGLPDSGVTACTAVLAERLLPFCSAETQIIAPSTGDFHPDHEACGHAALLAAQRSGAQLTSYFWWTWHRAEESALTRLHPGRFNLTEAAQQARAEALAEHRTQLERTDGEPVLPEKLLGPARWPFEVFLTEAR